MFEVVFDSQALKTNKQMAFLPQKMSYTITCAGGGGGVFTGGISI